MQVDFGVWGTVRNIAKVVLFFAGTGLLVTLYVPVIRQSNKLQKDIEIKRAALKKQQEIHQQYLEEIQAFRSNPDPVIQAAREKLGLVKPQEVLYRFESNDK